MGTTTRTATRIGAALAVVPFLAACQDGNRGITEIGEARPDGRPVPVEAADAGFVSPLLWPDACALLTEDELRAVLPSVQTVRQESGTHQMHARDFEPSPPKSACVYDLTLPVTGLRRHVGMEHGSGRVSVYLTAVGAPDAVARAYAAQKAKHERSHAPVREVTGTGATACYERNAHDDGNGGVTCHKGPIAFGVAVGPFRYIDLEGTRWDRKENFAEKVRERLVPPLLRTVAADI